MVHELGWYIPGPQILVTAVASSAEREVKEVEEGRAQFRKGTECHAHQCGLYMMLGTGVKPAVCQDSYFRKITASCQFRKEQGWKAEHHLGNFHNYADDKR